MIALLLGSVALAAGLHAGIPVRGVPDVSDPSFFTPAIGWAASVPGGQVRVFVGRTEADGAQWLQQQLLTFQVAQQAASGVGDASFGDGVTTFGFVDGNVGVVVLVDRDARAWAERLHGAIVDGPAWPAAPSPLRGADGRWTVDARDAAFVYARGGAAVPWHPDTFRVLPEEVVVWDAYGRPASWAGR